jgi:hypothetical protein
LTRIDTAAQLIAGNKQLFSNISANFW